MYTKPFDIVVNPTGSKFAKSLQQALQSKVKNVIYRRPSPKVVRSIISRRGNVLRQGYTRSHFTVTPRGLDKIEQFRRFTAAQVSCPGYCTNQDELRQTTWKSVFARTITNGTNGRGIIEFERASDPTPNAPLYTEYIPKKAEYRFHVFGGKVIDVQEKRKKRGVEERNTRIRNVNNGYVYCRDDINPPDGAADLAIRAVASLGYNYGAVDLIYNEKRNACYVLEVNSRPGLMGTTLDRYADALIEMFDLERK